MKKIKRTVNKKLVDALLGYAGSSFQDLADRVDPPVSRPAISNIMLKETCNERLQKQVTELLRRAAADLAFEIENLYEMDIFDALFPPVCVNHESVAPPVTELNHNILPERKGKL